MNQELLNRITINPAINKGRPSIRNMRFTVTQLLELLASGMTSSEILEDYPYLEAADISACLAYAAALSQTKSVTKISA
ncbi:MAG: DUF433 domain-containing protein [Bacteroidota bacterium]